MIKFQYLVTTVVTGPVADSHNVLAPILNERGQEGWDLVSVSAMVTQNHMSERATTVERLVFKRAYED